MTRKLSEGDLVRLVDRNHGDPPGGTVITDTGQLVWFTTATGGCHVARKRLVRLVRRAAQQEQGNEDADHHR